MPDKGPAKGGTPYESNPLDAWLRRADYSYAAEEAAQRRLQRACARMALSYMRKSFRRLDRELQACGHREDAAAMAGVVACVVLPVLLGVTMTVLLFTGVANSFGLSEPAQKVFAAVLPMLPMVSFGLFKSVSSCLRARHRDLREEADRNLSYAAAIQRCCAPASSSSRART